MKQITNTIIAALRKAFYSKTVSAPGPKYQLNDYNSVSGRRYIPRSFRQMEQSGTAETKENAFVTNVRGFEMEYC